MPPGAGRARSVLTRRVPLHPDLRARGAVPRRHREHGQRRHGAPLCLAPSRHRSALRAPQTLTGRGRAAPGVLGVPEEAAGHQLLRHPQAQAQVQERGAALLEIVGDLPELDLGAGQGARDAAGGDGARRAEEGAGRPRRQEERGVRLQRRLGLRGILVPCARDGGSLRRSSRT